MHFLLIIAIVWIVARGISKETRAPTGRVSTGRAQLHPYQRHQQELKTMEWFKNGGLRNSK